MNNGLKADLHVHSRMSTRPSQWILQKLDCPESFTSPLRLYEIAKSRGMDLVTITDHNTIDGALEIAHLDDVFISEEITAYFPENECKIHVLALDITESQHHEIAYLRANVYDLAAYLNSEKICHVLAHPMFDLNHKLSVEYFEKMLLLFKNFEMNGSRDAQQNRTLEFILTHLTPSEIDRLADKHGMAPSGDRFWEKNLTGGSDDHSSLNIARMHTFVPWASDREEFFRGLAEGRGRVRGEAATPMTIAHNLYSIAYQYYSSKYNLSRFTGKSLLFRFIHAALTLENQEKGVFARIQDFIAAKRPAFLNYAHSFSNGAPDVIIQQAERIISENDRFLRVLKAASPGYLEKEADWFEFVSEVSDEVIKSFADTILSSLSSAKLFNIFQAIGSAGAVYTLLAPFFVSFKLYVKDRGFADRCLAAFHEKGAAGGRRQSKIAIFTDTLYETNGVALTLRQQLEIAKKHDMHMTVLTCSPEDALENVVNFKPASTYVVPEYPELALHCPPLLKMVEYCYENGITLIHASTPGPVGLCALAVSRILDIPIHATYHTAIPQYAAELTGDFAMEEIMWKGMVWFYNQVDTVYAPSEATAAELAGKGISQSKIRLYPRGIDIKQFHPSMRNGFWQAQWRLPEDAFKVLYAGRISREKHLDVLANAFNILKRTSDRVHLLIVGDGPYRQQLEKRLGRRRVVFTGYLSGEALSQAYASSDLFVFPSTTDTFGNVVLEAQASGLPVIVSDQGGPRENLVHKKTGIIVPANDENALARAIMALMGDEDRLAEMKIHARQYVESRSFEAAFLETWNLYHNRPGKMKTNCEAA